MLHHDDDDDDHVDIVYVDDEDDRKVVVVKVFQLLVRVKRTLMRMGVVSFVFFPDCW